MTVLDQKEAMAVMLVKRILRKHGYPRDKHVSATRIVLGHARVLSAKLAA